MMHVHLARIVTPDTTYVKADFRVVDGEGLTRTAEIVDLRGFVHESMLMSHSQHTPNERTELSYRIVGFFDDGDAPIEWQVDHLPGACACGGTFIEPRAEARA